MVMVGRLIFYGMDEDPWCSHSGGEEPEYVGDIPGVA